MLIELRDDMIEQIEKLHKDHGLSYFDATLAYCHKTGLDEELVGQIISQNPSLKEKIAIDAENLNFLEKQDRLPI